MIIMHMMNLGFREIIDFKQQQQQQQIVNITHVL